MPTSVRLDASTEGLLRRLAFKKGVSKSQVIREALAVLARQEEAQEVPRTMYDEIADLIGCVDSGGANLSVRTGEKFSELLLERQKQRNQRRDDPR